LPLVVYLWSLSNSFATWSAMVAAVSGDWAVDVVSAEVFCVVLPPPQDAVSSARAMRVGIIEFFMVM
jgi:hypothetical protein